MREIDRTSGVVGRRLAAGPRRVGSRARGVVLLAHSRYPRARNRAVGIGRSQCLRIGRSANQRAAAFSSPVGTNRHLGSGAPFSSRLLVNVYQVRGTRWVDEAPRD